LEIIPISLSLALSLLISISLIKELIISSFKTREVEK
jgi:hypothetical protein